MVASDILRESGFETFHAYDAADAAVLLQEHPEIELMVTEAELPGNVTGLDLCRQVSEERPDVGARVLRKPYASGELRTVVASKMLLEA
jgi:CheY-like chemotaxis protein